MMLMLPVWGPHFEEQGSQFKYFLLYLRLDMGAAHSFWNKCHDFRIATCIWEDNSGNSVP